MIDAIEDDDEDSEDDRDYGDLWFFLKRRNIFFKNS